MSNLEETCRQCAGAGKIPTQENKAWRKRFAAAIKKGTVQEAMKSCGDEPLPAETVCDECAGAGMLLTQAGNALLAFFRSHKDKIFAADANEAQQGDASAAVLHICSVAEKPKAGTA